MNEKYHQLDEYFEMYSDAVLVYARRIVKDHYTAEDICQDTFFALGENLHKVDPDCVPGWLLRTAKRKALDHLKKGGRYKMEYGLEEKEEFIQKSGEDAGSILERKEAIREKFEVYLKLKKEKPDLYEALHMSCVEGMSDKDIAQELHISAALVGKRKQRGRDWLKKHYEAYRKKGS